MKKITDILKGLNYLKVVVFAAGFAALVLGLIYVTGTNDISIATNGNVAIYPTLGKSLVLFTSAHPFWAYLSGALILLASLVFEAMSKDYIAGLGVIIGGIALPAIFSIVSVYSPASRIQTFTHHTVTAAEYASDKTSKTKLDSYFTVENQVDSLYLLSFGKNAQ